MSYFGKYYLTGPDAQKAADWIFTARMDGEQGKTIYTCMLNKQAGIEADLTVSLIEPGAGSAADPEFQGTGFYISCWWSCLSESCPHHKVNPRHGIRCET